MKISNGEGYSERELIEKAVKYDILVNAIINNLEYSNWGDQIEVYGTAQIGQTLKSLEPYLMERTLETLREKWKTEHPEENEN